MVSQKRNEESQHLDGDTDVSFEPGDVPIDQIEAFGYGGFAPLISIVRQAIARHVLATIDAPKLEPM